MTFRGVQIRLFLTCWLIYGLHFATEFVREHYLVVSMVDDRSFDLTRYRSLNPDIFTNPPNAPHGGVHQGANPGISMLGALVYAPLKPAVDAVVRRELAARGDRDTLAVFRDETRPNRLKFYQETRRKGLDVRFGLVAMITAVLCMAPIAALSVVIMFRLFEGAGLARRLSLGLALAYAFATPVFFRASYLNHNLAIGVYSALAFLLLWNPGGRLRMRESYREVTAGLLGGLCLLHDYSGGLSLALLGGYLVWRVARTEGWSRIFVPGLRYTAGAIPGIALLWFYQWRSFGNPFLPPQHWMPPVEWSNVGYQGVGGFQWELFRMLLVDPRFGLLVCSPVLILAFATPFLRRRVGALLPTRELVFCYVYSAVFLLFFSTVQYTRLQWVSGGPRYLVPVVPFLFLASAVALVRLPRIVSYAFVVLSFVVTWSMTMVRSQTGVLDSVQQTIVGGIRLPALTTYSRMATQYAPWLHGDASPFPILMLATAVLAAIWFVRPAWAPLLRGGSGRNHLERHPSDDTSHVESSAARMKNAAEEGPLAATPARARVDLVIPVLNEAHVLERA